VGVDKLSQDLGKIDIITYSDSFYTHRQIESKNGLVFMRIKKRSIRLEEV